VKENMTDTSGSSNTGSGSGSGSGSGADLVLTGNDLCISALVAAARNPSSSVTLSSESYKKMKENRAFAEKVAARGDDVYGLTTGVGMRKKRKIGDSVMVEFNSRMIREHATGQG
jgi:histidine ammonia-lyase